MRLHVILAVLKRNVASYFTGVLGYLFITAFVALAVALAFDGCSSRTTIARSTA